MSLTTGLNSRSPRDRSRANSALPSLPFPRSETVSSAKRSSSVVSTDVEALRVAGVLVDLPILRLRRADLVEVDAVVFVDAGAVLALRRLGIAAVIEAVALPRDARDLDPVHGVGQRLLRRQLDDLVDRPVGAVRLHAVDGVLRVRRRRERRRASSCRPTVGIDEDLGCAVDPFLDVEHALILEPVVLPEEVVRALARRRRVLRVVVELLDARLQLLRGRGSPRGTGR